MTWIRLSIYALACYRLALLLGEDSGPYRLASRFRAFLKREAKHNKVVAKSDVARGVECPRCSSVWFGAVISAYIFLRYYLPTWAVATCEAFFLCLALSTITILLNRAFPEKP